jgi:hypothetical protein
MATKHNLTNSFVDLYALTGKTPDTDLSIFVENGTIYLDDEVTPDEVISFTEGQWAFAKAPQLWIKAKYLEATIVVSGR